MSFLDQVPHNSREQVEDLLKTGRYQLLLGAGASRDSRSADGSILPLAMDMVGELNSLTSSVQTRITGAFQVALSKDPTNLSDYLSTRFTACSPSNWWKTALDCAWKRIWTLNIDDVVERALALHPNWNTHRTRSYSWHDLLQEHDGLQVVHLHGVAGRDKPSNMVFSISQYAEATRKEHGWHRKFFDDWSQDPFITIGASLFEEIDLSSAIQTRPASPHVPSLYVSPGISPETRELLEIANLIPIDCTAEDFFAEVEEFTRKARATLRFEWMQSGARPEIAAGMAQQFEKLRLVGDFLDRDRDFYAGDNPEWVDIVKNRPVNLSWYDQLADKLASKIKPDSQYVELLFSKRLAGRTVALLEVSKILLERGFDVFLFRPTRRPDVPMIREFLSTRSRAVLVFDGITDFLDDISHLLADCSKSGTSCVILAGDLYSRRRAVRTQLDMSFAGEFAVPRSRHGSWPLSREDAEAVVAKIVDVGRFGLISNLSHAERITIFRNHEVFDGLSRAEYGRGFRSRVHDELLGIPEGNIRGLVGLIALLSSQDRGFPLGFASAAGVDSNLLNSELRTGVLGSVLHVNGTILRSRFRALTLEDVYPGSNKDGFLEVLVDFLASISVYAGKISRQQRGQGYIIIKTLMRAGLVRHVLGKHYISEFYDRLESSYAQDARYWEQRARGQVYVRDFTRAMSFAAKAIDLAPDDSWRLTTYGDICLLRACNEFTVGSSGFWKLYDVGHASLDRALLVGYDNSLPPLLGIKRSMLAYYKYLSGGRIGGESVASDLETDINRQFRSAYSLGCIGQTVQALEVRELEHEFLRWVASSPVDLASQNFVDKTIFNTDLVDEIAI